MEKLIDLVDRSTSELIARRCGQPEIAPRLTLSDRSRALCRGEIALSRSPRSTIARASSPMVRRSCRTARSVPRSSGSAGPIGTASSVGSRRFGSVASAIHLGSACAAPPCEGNSRRRTVLRSRAGPRRTCRARGVRRERGRRCPTRAGCPVASSCSRRRDERALLAEMLLRVATTRPSIKFPSCDRLHQDSSNQVRSESPVTFEATSAHSFNAFRILPSTVLYASRS